MTGNCEEPDGCGKKLQKKQQAAAGQLQTVAKRTNTIQVLHIAYQVVPRCCLALRSLHRPTVSADVVLSRRDLSVT